MLENNSISTTNLYGCSSIADTVVLLPYEVDCMTRWKDDPVQYKREYREKNKERIKEWHKQWRINNPERIKELARKSGCKYRLKNKEKIRERRYSRRCIDCKILICGKQRCSKCHSLHSPQYLPSTLGENNHNWKGGTYTHSAGYIMIHSPNHPYKGVKGYIGEHRLVMEKHIDRYLEPKEVVHHIDFDVTNNHVDNLHLFPSVGKHLKYHAFLRQCVRDLVKTDKQSRLV